MAKIKLDEDNYVIGFVTVGSAPNDFIEVPEPLPDDLEIGNYKYINGFVKAEPKIRQEETPVPTETERLEALEAAMLDLILGGGAND